MGSALAKQFMLLAGKPVLMHTIKRFHDADKAIQLIVVLPSNENIYWKGLCQQHTFTIPHQVVSGGETRFHSVRNGLDLIPDGCLVAVHDGVRPFVSKKLILSCYEEAAVHGNAIPCVSFHESIRKVYEDSNEPVDRNEFQLIQTPQSFQSSILKKAYNETASEEFTDDATVLEESGIKIHLVHGLKENIKITTQPDLHMAEGLIKYFQT